MDKKSIKKLIENVFTNAYNSTSSEKITSDDLYWEHTTDNCDFLCFDEYDIGISVYKKDVAFNEGTPEYERVQFDNTDRIIELTQSLFNEEF